MTKDFFALSVLDPLIVGDESARLLSEARARRIDSRCR